MTKDDEVYIGGEVTALTIEALIFEAHSTAQQKGWWEEERNFGEALALIHSEVSEALEEYRDNGATTNSLYYVRDGKGHFKPEGVASEMADILIRVADVCAGFEIPLLEALTDKLEYNKTRDHRHGGRLA